MQLYPNFNEATLLSMYGRGEWAMRMAQPEIRYIMLSAGQFCTYETRRAYAVDLTLSTIQGIRPSYTHDFLSLALAFSRLLPH